jgi:hypothetical protein
MKYIYNSAKILVFLIAALAIPPKIDYLLIFFGSHLFQYYLFYAFNSNNTI